MVEERRTCYFLQVIGRSTFLKVLPAPAQLPRIESKNISIEMTYVVMDKTQTSRPWYFHTKKLQERVSSLSLWTVPTICFLVGLVYVLYTSDSTDPIFAPGTPWGRLRGLSKISSEGSHDKTLSIGQQLPDTDEHGLVGEPVVDDGYFIRQTNIWGKNAVDQFRAHTDCLSASGRWIYDPTPRKLPWLRVKLYDWVRKCDNEHVRHRGLAGEMADYVALSNGTGETWSVREELKWIWRSNESSCPWHPMDRDDFCRRIGSKRNVLVVGDSINHEISVAIQNALLMNKSSAVTVPRYPGEEMCSDVLGGEGKGFQVSFARNDFLSLVVNNSKVARNIQEPWMSLLEEGEGAFKILILNRGAHYQDDAYFVGGLRATFEVLRDRHPDLLVIFRNTPSGHVNCTDFHAPIDEPLKGALRSFHWEDFDRQNQLAKDIVEEFQYIYVDVARPIGMRPEGHQHSRDCLHYCQPGPLDLAVEMIYNVLLLLP